MDAPTGAARWFNQLDTDYAVGPHSRVQALDVADMPQDSLYQYWIDQTTPHHPLLADPAVRLLQQVKAGNQWPEVLVVNCHGDVTWRRAEELTQTGYAELKKAIDDTIENTMCPL